MNFCRKTIWLLVAVTALLPAGCASQRGRMASKKPLNTAQLLAAARQYEKEGNLQSAGNIYKHVLQFHPGNSDAKQGLAMVQQGKLRVNYDPQQLLASSNPAIKSNPQAREQLAKVQQQQREQVNERMAELIAQAAKNPQAIEVDSTPTPAVLASVEARPVPTAATPAAPTPAPPKPVQTASVPPQTSIAQAAAIEPTPDAAPIETTGFARTRSDEVPSDWQDDSWQAHSLTSKCQDASAAVLDQVHKLESQADSDRKDGLSALALMGPEAIAAAPAVRRLLNDQNQLVMAHAAWAIWAIEGDADTSVKLLQECLSSKSTHVVQFSAYTLGNMGEFAAPTASQLQMLLTDSDSFTRLHAAEALTRITRGEQRSNAIDSLMVLLSDEEAGVRQLAALTLGQIEGESAAVAIAALTTALDDADAGVRSAAALSLGAYGKGAKDAISRLEEVADSDHTDVREAAHTALACIKL